MKADKQKRPDVEIDRYLKEAVSIEPMALEEEFVRLPADLAYWSTRYSEALGEYLTAKTERERILGDLMCDPRVVDTLEDRLGKKPTVDQIKGAVLNVEGFVEARQRENDADVQRTRLKGFVDALSTKRDMLISLGAHARLEMANDPVIRRNAADRREIDQHASRDDDEEGS